MITEYAISVDLGQAQDHIALSIVGYDPGGSDAKGRAIGNEHYQILWLEQYPLGTTYRAIIEAAKRHWNNPRLEGKSTLLIDRGEVGKAVIEMFREEGLPAKGIAITSGQESRRVAGGWNVPKKDLVYALVAAYSTGRTTLYQAAPGSTASAIADKFKQELLSFKMKISKSGNQQFEAMTEADHDDIVMSVAMGVWYLREYGQELAEQEQTMAPEWDALRHGL